MFDWAKGWGFNVFILYSSTCGQCPNLASLSRAMRFCRGPTLASRRMSKFDLHPGLGNGQWVTNSYILLFVYARSLQICFSKELTFPTIVNKGTTSCDIYINDMISSTFLIFVSPYIPIRF